MVLYTLTLRSCLCDSIALIKWECVRWLAYSFQPPAFLVWIIKTSPVCATCSAGDLTLRFHLAPLEMSILAPENKCAFLSFYNCIHQITNIYDSLEVVHFAARRGVWYGESSTEDDLNPTWAPCSVLLIEPFPHQCEFLLVVRLKSSLTLGV